MTDIFDPNDAIIPPPLNPPAQEAADKLAAALSALNNGTLRSHALICFTSDNKLSISFHGPNLCELHVAAAKLSDIFKSEIFK